MPCKRKNPVGRPPNPLPPRIDATAEEIAHVVLNAGRPKGPVAGRDYHCADCGKQVVWPDILYDDGRCEGCHREVTE